MSPQGFGPVKERKRTEISSYLNGPKYPTINTTDPGFLRKRKNYLCEFTFWRRLPLGPGASSSVRYKTPGAVLPLQFYVLNPATHQRLALNASSS